MPAENDRLWNRSRPLGRLPSPSRSRREQSLSRDHLLTEVLRRCFQHFAAHLDDRPPQEDPGDDLRQLGVRYLGFAQAHPLQYRLMFSTKRPEAAKDGGS